MKKTSRKTWIRKLDKLVADIVKARDKRCVQCGTDKNLTCGHVFSRVNYSTRWDLLNCHCQCLGCNLKHEHDAWPYYKWFITKFGQPAFDELYLKHHQISKLKDWQLEELYEALK